MADENKTILQIDGDASGAKRAAQETVAAIQSIAAEEKAATRAATQLTDTTREQGAALQALAKESGVQDTSAEFEGMGEAADKAGGGVDKIRDKTRAMAGALRAVSPEAAELIMKFEDLKEVGEGAMGLTGAGALVATGAIAAVGFAVTSITNAVKKAREELKQLNQELDEYEAKRIASRGGAREQAGMHGIPGADAAAAIDTLARQLQSVVSKEAAMTTAGAVVGARKAGMQLTEKQIEDLAMLQQAGSLRLDRGANIEDTGKNVQQSLGLIDRLPTADRRALDAKTEQAARNKLERMRAIAAGNEEMARDYLENDVGLPAKRAEKMAAQLKELLAMRMNQGTEAEYFASRGARGKGSYEVIRQFRRDLSAAERDVDDLGEPTDYGPRPTARPKMPAKPISGWGDMFEDNKTGGGGSAPQAMTRPSPNAGFGAPTIINFNGPTAVAIPPKSKQSRTP